MTIDAQQRHFDERFAQQADPWRYRTSWYEARKRALLLAALPRMRYQHAFEPGCAIGVLSAELAGRCAQLLCADFSVHALAEARRHLAPFAHVRVEARAMPRDWPVGDFDLIIVSELAYYLDAADCSTLAQLACGALDEQGTLVCCHWRHAADDFIIDGAEVHARFAQAAHNAALKRVFSASDEDFLLDVWSQRT